jgi:hypothetical protein
MHLTIAAGFVQEDVNEYPGGPDILPERVTIKAGYDGSTAPVVIALVNGTTNSGAGNYYTGN